MMEEDENDSSSVAEEHKEDNEANQVRDGLRFCLSVGFRARRGHR